MCNPPINSVTNRAINGALMFVLMCVAIGAVTSAGCVAFAMLGILP